MKNGLRKSAVFALCAFVCVSCSNDSGTKDNTEKEESQFPKEEDSSACMMGKTNPLLCVGIEEACASGSITDPTLCAGPANGILKKCQQLIDPDADGNIGCTDLHCLALDMCIRDGGPEDTFERCTDGIDNDYNGYADCADNSCGKGYVGADKALLDAYCISIKENTFLKCSDGIDNDGNHYADCQDPKCRAQPSALPDSASEAEKQQYAKDYAEFSKIQEYCASMTEETFEKCTDGIDNDNNGYVDCGDFGCSRSRGPDKDRILAYCEQRAENTFEHCSDGKDNDENGYTDCEDYSCLYNENEEIQNYCNPP